MYLVHSEFYPTRSLGLLTHVVVWKHWHSEAWIDYLRSCGYDKRIHGVAFLSSIDNSERIKA